MPKAFKQLCAAILDDNRAQVKKLLEHDPLLARNGVAEEEVCSSTIAHWIYRGDPALHVAAAGYRVEIAKMLLAAGAEISAAKNRRSGQPLHYAADGYLQNPSWDA